MISDLNLLGQVVIGQIDLVYRKKVQYFKLHDVPVFANVSVTVAWLEISVGQFCVYCRAPTFCVYTVGSGRQKSGRQKSEMSIIRIQDKLKNTLNTNERCFTRSSLTAFISAFQNAPGGSAVIAIDFRGHRSHRRKRSRYWRY